MSESLRTIFVTGGAGFIGSAVVRMLLGDTSGADANRGTTRVVNIDKLTYAGGLESVESVSANAGYHFEQVDICDAAAVEALFVRYDPDVVLHLAAESHVDRSIDGAAPFIQTNVVGTFTLLEASRRHFAKLTGARRDAFRFVHVSTDEVYGSLGADGLFTEETPYDPSSPYSASKASSDHLARAWHRTYGLPVVVTNCSNNFGPYQYPEKLIPVVILNALAGNAIPVYGKGDNVRDWLYVDDHAHALLQAAERGVPGSTYNVGSRNERTNLQLIHAVCKALDELHPSELSGGYESLVTFVKDRPGHDHRYAIDPTKIERELGWASRVPFEVGIRTTVQWYLENQEWCRARLPEASPLRIGLGT